MFDRLTDSYDWTGLFVPATTFLFTTLYVFDFNDWDTKKPFVKFLKALLTVVGIVLLGACAAFASKEYPPLLLAYVILLIPGWFFFVRLLTESTNQIEEATDAHLFLRKIAWPLITYSVVMFLYWFIWVVWADMPDIGEWQVCEKYIWGEEEEGGGGGHNLAMLCLNPTYPFLSQCRLRTHVGISTARQHLQNTPHDLDAMMLTTPGWTVTSWNWPWNRPQIAFLPT